MKYLFSSFIFIFMIHSVQSEIIIVPTDYESISEAIEHADDGDTVLIENGDYHENVVARNQTFTLASRYILDHDTSHIDSTILHADDNNETYSPLRIYLEDENSVRISGLSITGGRLTLDGYLPNQNGGGIYINNGRFHIDRCHIFNNLAFHGGGIYFDEAEGVVEYCSIYNNLFKVCGGGICFSLDEAVEGDRAGHVLIRNNHIFNNTYVDTVYNSWSGGIGISCQWAVRGIIRDNIIENNVVKQDAGGIGIGFSMLMLGNVWEVSGNVISFNSAQWNAGVLAANVDTLYFFSNTVESNSATLAWGGGLSIYTPLSHYNNIYHNIFRNNSGNSGGAILTKANAHIHHNMFIGNRDGRVSAIKVWTGNIYDRLQVNVNHNIFVNNSPLDNPEDYIAAVSAYTTDNIINLKHNDFIGNRGYAVGLPEPDVRLPGEIYADSNYWGDPSGPYHSEENPNGLGDTVRSNISIEPFSTTPFTA
ncbi:MAG: hypothetical protein P9L92_20130, partial [Candidatus Electryonea clarkiae]|nr:hypothetical protein [Candidatus Electryonea clarkiae]